MGVVCRSRNACNNELNWASDGATVTGLGQTIDRIQINERLLCTVLANSNDIYIRDRSCHEERYFACQGGYSIDILNLGCKLGTGLGELQY